MVVVHNTRNGVSALDCIVSNKILFLLCRLQQLLLIATFVVRVQVVDSFVTVERICIPVVHDRRRTAADCAVVTAVRKSPLSSPKFSCKSTNNRPYHHQRRFTYLFSESSTSVGSSRRNSSSTETVSNTRATTATVPSNVKILILPGFGNIMSDYILPSALAVSNVNEAATTGTPSSTQTYQRGSLVQSFVNRGWQYNHNIFVLPIQQRYEWLQVFVYGLFDVQFLLYSTAPPTNPAFLWYLQKVVTTIQTQIMRRPVQLQPPVAVPDSTVLQPTTKTNTTKIILVGHSAGGWLGRAAIAYLLKQQQQSNPNESERYVIRGLVTLGTPHLPPPMSQMDMTRGALRYTHTNYPGAYQHYYYCYQHEQQQEPEQQSRDSDDVATTNTKNINATTTHSDTKNTIFYITVCGDAIQGKKDDDDDNTVRVRDGSPTTARMRQFAYDSYQAVCGNGTTHGDGVVPVCSAHLDDAIQITIPNVYHSINVPDQWYGTDDNDDVDDNDADTNVVDSSSSAAAAALSLSSFDIWYNQMMEQIVDSS